MKVKIIERTELPSKLARLLDSKLDNRQLDDFYILPGVTQEQAITHCWPVLEEAASLLGDSVWRCLTDMRHLKVPIGIWDDSAYARKIRNLCVTPDPKFISKIKEVAKMFATSKQHLPEYFWVNKLSNGGFPHFTNSPKLKINQYLDGLEKVNSNEKLPGISSSTLRVQAEAIIYGSDNRIAPKPRKWMYTKENAADILDMYNIDITKFENVNIEDTYIWGEHITKVNAPFVQPARPRWASAVDLETNSPSMATGSGVLMPHGVSEPLYVIRSIDELLSFVKGGYVSCLDFENFERTVTYPMISAIVEVLSFYHPSLSRIYANMYEAYFNMLMYGIDMLPNDRGKMTYIYTEMKSDPLGIFGILSGWGHTSQLGKIIGTAFVAYCLEEIGISCKEIHEYENLMRNCGDDNVVKFNSSNDREKFEKFVLEQDQLKVGLENPKKYLGMEILEKDSIADGVSMSAISFIENTLCPEREAGSSFRKFAVLGLFQRWELYKVHMANDQILDLCQRFYDLLRELIPNFDSILEEEREASVNDADIDEFLKKFNLNKPEEIFYKLDSRKLSKEDLSMIGLVIPRDEVTSRIPGILELPNLE